MWKGTIRFFGAQFFNLTSSEIYLPLRKSGRVIGVLQMGSDDIVEFSALSNVNDDIVVQSDLKMIQLIRVFAKRRNCVQTFTANYPSNKNV